MLQISHHQIRTVIEAVAMYETIGSKQALPIVQPAQRTMPSLDITLT